MRTGLIKRYGYRTTVQQYMKQVLEHHKCSDRVGEIARRMYYRLAQDTSFTVGDRSMLAMTLVNLASIECHQRIPSWAWSGNHTCAYPTVLRHSKELKKILEKIYEYPNLKRTRLGK